MAAAGPEGLILGGQGPKLLLFSAAEGVSLQATAPIVIFPQELKISPDLILPSSSILVLDSQNRPGAAFAAQSGLRILDCGLASKNTLTLSSFSGEDAVVCLQRPVEDRLGRTVEPFELPLQLRQEVAAYPLLCCAAVFILGGWWEALNNLVL